MSENTVTVTVDLDKVAEGVSTYYSQMADGQLAELLGDTDHAFAQAKKVIATMAGILEDVVGHDNVARINDLVNEREVSGN